ncbi:glutaredoxin domain-containing protein [Pyrenochaeta sp. DS3sAY3a]|nr:glutaredoxin domain-containing protein [Pyrenochaeta sp. DS3sAY3a]
MPSQRRMRLFAILVVVTITVIFYVSRGAHQTRTSDFYTKTQEALQERQYEEAARQRDAESIGSRLKAAEEQAKNAAEEKYKSQKVAVEGEDPKSVAGRVKIDGEKVPGVAAQGGKAREQAVVQENETTEDHEVEMEMNAILKKGPMIIFSKTYCPYSKKAKHILLEKYRIEPEPYVVELDIHPLGEQLQLLLGKLTGRKTVPNVFFMGKSIGGGDDIEELDETDALVNLIKEMGGSRISQVEYRGARAETRHRRAKRS